MASSLSVQSLSILSRNAARWLSNNWVIFETIPTSGNDTRSQMQTMVITTQLQVMVKTLLQIWLKIKIEFKLDSYLICIVFSGDRLDEGTMEVTDQNHNYGEF